MPFRIGISSCLLGEKVRFDGGHKHDRYLTDVFGKFVEWVPVCPEFEAGMGIPREPVRLVGSVEAPRMIGTKSAEDWTSRMLQYSDRRVNELEDLKLSGFIFKSASPSCGFDRVKVYGDSGAAAKNGRGLFANAFIQHFPLVPVEEEGRLNDGPIRENFIVRVFAFHRLQQLFDTKFRRGSLVAFHASQKYLLLAHSPKHYALMGRLVADAKKHSPSEFKDRYSQLFMEALSVKTTTKKNVNVLLHILGFLRGKITAVEKQNVLPVVEEYAQGLVPLVVPLTLVQHYVKVHDVAYIRDQAYLNPHPKELMLRNRV